MTSNPLPWHWVIETLANCKQVDTSVLGDLILKDAEILIGAPVPVREKVALRYLEKLVDVDREEGPSEWASSGKIDVNRSCEEVLSQEMRKVARLFNLEKDKVNLLTPDLHKFILQKRASLSGSSLDKIKAAILQGHCQALLPLKEISGLLVQNEVDNFQGKVSDESQRAKKLQVSTYNTEMESLRQSPAAPAPDGCNGLLQEECTISIPQFPNQIVEGFKRMLQGDGVNTGGSYQNINEFTGNERKKIKLSTKDYHAQSNEKDSGLLAPGSNTVISQEDASESMQHLVKLNVTATNDKTIIQGSMCELPGRENIDAGGVQMPQPQQISSCPVPANINIIMTEDSPRVGQRLPLDVFVMDDDHAHLMKDATITKLPCNEGGSLQHVSVDGSGEKMNSAFFEKSCLNVQLSVTPEIAGDGDGSCNVLSDAELHNDIFAAEKHRLLSSQVHINDDSAIGGCTEQGLCIKCDKGGELLTCGGNGCLISVHESCLGSSPIFDTSGLFYCPFCSYTRAAISYRKVKKNFIQARRVLSEFIGGNFVRGHRKVSPSGVHKETIQTRVVDNSCSEHSAGSSQCKGNKPNEISVEVDEHSRVEGERACDNCTSLMLNGNADLSKVHIVPQSNGEQVEVAEHQHLRDPYAAADNCPGDSCHARDIDVRQGDIVMIEDHCNVQQLKTPEEEGLMLNGNADLSKGHIVPRSNKEQVEVAKHQHLREPYAAAVNCPGDPCHARDINDVRQADIVMIEAHSNIQQLKTPEEEGHATVDKVTAGEKHGKRQLEDILVVDNNGRNKSSPAKSKRHISRAKRYSNPILPPTRRTKLSWTPEEEEFLREAVHELGEKNDGSIPWVKILELGRHVIHKTRQPGDLKDKWRNMKKKEASRTLNR
ncbi:uncharacterized protein LOC103985310 isoform X2 [Musa acuminata AAA Group]|uniref:uncharacterized protein LOC103985310 isoform X2 n=1 Tax=Musa acuminata AAA Group TaxID=214697 RepID=UPI0031CDE334